jgi:hypothetical protein
MHKPTYPVSRTRVLSSNQQNLDFTAEKLDPTGLKAHWASEEDSKRRCTRFSCTINEAKPGYRVGSMISAVLSTKDHGFYYDS